MIKRPEGATKGELDLIESTFRVSAYFRRQRHTRKCQRCRAWLAVDQPDPCMGRTRVPRNGASKLAFPPQPDCRVPFWRSSVNAVPSHRRQYPSSAASGCHPAWGVVP